MPLVLVSRRCEMERKVVNLQRPIVENAALERPMISSGCDVS